jgi:hypothetical protein
MSSVMLELAAHGASPIRYTDAELEEDRRTLAEPGRAISS